MLSDFLIHIADSWAQYAVRLSEDRVQAVTRQLAAAVHTARWQPDELVSELREAVPEEDEAWSTLLRQPVRGSTVAEPVALTVAAARLRWAIETSALETLAGYEGQLRESVEDAAESRLFTAPMIPVEDGTAEFDLVVLERWSERWAPAFQFEADGSVAEEVSSVNRLLDADGDPWGAAAWWLSPHSSLGAIPADAVKLGLGDEVLAAAVAAGDLP